ncbi:reverse transcriptase domain-containing protein [Tanacetum coccineum]
MNASDDNTNVVNALREPCVVNQDLGVKSSQDPPQIDHNCCYECGDSLDGIFCQQCICKSCGKGAARTWLEKEPPNSITTWNDLVSKFLNRFFPPSKTTNLRNEITRFQQRFGETFAEASNGNFLTKNTQEALTIIENKSKVQTSRNKPQVAINSVQNGCETCGGPHAYYECQAIGGYTKRTFMLQRGYNHNQPQSNVLSFEEMMNQHMKITKARMQQMQEYNNLQLQQLKNHNTNIANKMDQMQKVLMERPHGVLSSNTVPNPREDLKAITTQSGVTLAGPSVPPPPLSSSKEVDREPEMITDQLPHAPVSSPVIPEPNPHQPSIPYPSRLNKEKLQGKADIQIHSFLQMFKKIHFNISFAEALAHMPKFAKMVKDLLTNKEKLLELANKPLNENCSAVLLKKLPENLETLGDTILPDLSSTHMTLELATRTVAYPAVNYEVDARDSSYLEAVPFLWMAHALVDVLDRNSLLFEIGDEELGL